MFVFQSILFKCGIYFMELKRKHFSNSGIYSYSLVALSDDIRCCLQLILELGVQLLCFDDSLFSHILVCSLIIQAQMIGRY